MPTFCISRKNYGYVYLKSLQAWSYVVCSMGRLFVADIKLSLDNVGARVFLPKVGIGHSLRVDGSFHILMDLRAVGRVGLDITAVQAYWRR